MAPVPVLEPPGASSQSTIGVDGANNAYVVSVVDGLLKIDLIGPNLRSTQGVPNSVVGQDHPALITNSRGETFLAYTQSDASSGENGREIRLVNNIGGSFGRSRNVSLNDLDDYSPNIDLDYQGLPHMVWTQAPVGEPETTMVIYWNHIDGLRHEMSLGASPDIALDGRGFVHIIFARAGDVFYMTNRTESGAFSEPAPVVNTPTSIESSPQLVVTESGELTIVFLVRDNLMMVQGSPDGVFGPQRFLTDGVSEVSLRMRRGGTTYAIVFRKESDIWFTRGIGSFLLEPTRIGTPTPSDEFSPSMITDACGNLHMCFVREGMSYYTNNAEDIAAEFSTSTTTGEPNLSVQFEDLSSGKVQLWRWDFGDGETSNAQNPKHVYAEPGKYTVSLTVFAADRQSTITKEDLIIIQEPFNTLEIPNVSVVPNQKEVWFPLIAGHKDPIRGFQVMTTFDPNILDFQRCTFAFTLTESLRPEFFQCNEFDSRLEIGCLFDFEPPFELRVLPPGERQLLLHLIFDVHTDAPQGAVSELRLVNDSVISRIFNIFTVDGFTKFPKLTSSRIDVRGVIPPPRFFLRGDVDSNGSIEITDAVKLLNFLFIGGPPPACMDAADFNDRGAVDISGAISVLNFLFLGGAAPRVPYPVKGIDPTTDGLTCEG